MGFRAWLLTSMAVLSVPAVAGCGDEDDRSPAQRRIDELKEGLSPAQIERIDERAERRTEAFKDRIEKQIESGKPQDKPTSEPKPSSPAYESANALCSEFPAKAIASEYNADGTDFESAAYAYSRTYQPEFQQDAYEGCIDAYINP